MSATTTPEVSIIIPIIDRAETFDSAVGIALGQTLDNIEVLLALAKPTAQVTAIAQKWAQADPRVRVFDRPLCPGGRTGVARHAAVLDARSDKILVLQDDDFWLPTHAEGMSILLDEADIAFNTQRAVTLSFRELAWQAAMHLELNREMCRERQKKYWYEAHYGFRLSTYHALGVRWDQAERALSGVFCDAAVRHPQPLRWITGPQVTSWSFNSAPRDNPAAPFSSAEKVAEHRRWARHLESGPRARPIWLEGLSFVRSQFTDRFDSYEALVSGIGLRDLGLERGSEADEELRHMHEALDGVAKSREELLPMVPNALETGARNLIAIRRLDNILQNSFPPKARMRLVRDAAEAETGLRRSYCLAYATHLALKRRAVDKAGTLWQDALAAERRIETIALDVACRLANAAGDDARMAQLVAPHLAQEPDRTSIGTFRIPERLRR